MAKSNLKSAKRDKFDEFYTKMDDIAQEIKHYKNDFFGKTIICNCDDPYESNFFKYFAINFNFFGLKKLIATCYDGSPVAGEQLNLFENFDENDTHAYKVEITKIEDYNGDGVIDIFDVEYMLKNMDVVKKLKGNGDFRSDECLALLDEADIAVTNPPFSLFREYLTTMVEHKKDFIIMGNTNALGYRETFRLFKNNQIRTGYTNFNVGMYFYVPDSVEKYAKIENGKKMIRVSTSCWFTNLSVSKHNEPLTLFRKYIGHEQEFPKYFNFDAINVDKYSEIPCDYDGYIGVPLTFLDKYNPNQFEIIGLGISNSGIEMGVRPYLPEHKKYRKEVQHRGAVDGDLYFLDKDGHPDVPYSRIIIRRRGDNNA